MISEQCQHCDWHKRPDCLKLGRKVRRKQKAKIMGRTPAGKIITCFAGDKPENRTDLKRIPRNIGLNTIRRRMNNTHFKHN
jgi:hypothetical protein